MKCQQVQYKDKALKYDLDPDLIFNFSKDHVEYIHKDATSNLTLTNTVLASTLDPFRKIRITSVEVCKSELGEPLLVIICTDETAVNHIYYYNVINNISTKVSFKTAITGEISKTSITQKTFKVTYPSVSDPVTKPCYCLIIGTKENHTTLILLHYDLLHGTCKAETTELMAGTNKTNGAHVTSICILPPDSDDRRMGHSDPQILLGYSNGIILTYRFRASIYGAKAPRLRLPADISEFVKYNGFPITHISSARFYNSLAMSIAFSQSKPNSNNPEYQNSLAYTILLETQNDTTRKKRETIYPPNHLSDAVIMESRLVPDTTSLSDDTVQLTILFKSGTLYQADLWSISQTFISRIMSNSALSIDTQTCESMIGAHHQLDLEGYLLVKPQKVIQLMFHQLVADEQPTTMGNKRRRNSVSDHDGRKIQDEQLQEKEATPHQPRISRRRKDAGKQHQTTLLLKPEIPDVITNQPVDSIDGGNAPSSATDDKIMDPQHNNTMDLQQQPINTNSIIVEPQMMYEMNQNNWSGNSVELNLPPSDIIDSHAVEQALSLFSSSLANTIDGDSSFMMDMNTTFEKNNYPLSSFNPVSDGYNIQEEYEAGQKLLRAQQQKEPEQRQTSASNTVMWEADEGTLSSQEVPVNNAKAIIQQEAEVSNTNAIKENSETDDPVPQQTIDQELKKMATEEKEDVDFVSETKDIEGEKLETAVFVEEETDTERTLSIAEQQLQLVDEKEQAAVVVMTSSVEESINNMDPQHIAQEQKEEFDKATKITAELVKDKNIELAAENAQETDTNAVALDQQEGKNMNNNEEEEGKDRFYSDITEESLYDNTADYEYNDDEEMFDAEKAKSFELVTATDIYDNSKKDASSSPFTDPNGNDDARDELYSDDGYSGIEEEEGLRTVNNSTVPVILLDSDDSDESENEFGVTEYDDEEIEHTDDKSESLTEYQIIQENEIIEEEGDEPSLVNDLSDENYQILLNLQQSYKNEDVSSVYEESLTEKDQEENIQETEDNQNTTEIKQRSTVAVDDEDSISMKDVAYVSQDELEHGVFVPEHKSQSKDASSILATTAVAPSDSKPSSSVDYIPMSQSDLLRHLSDTDNTPPPPKENTIEPVQTEEDLKKIRIEFKQNLVYDMMKACHIPLDQYDPIQQQYLLSHDQQDRVGNYCWHSPEPLLKLYMIQYCDQHQLKKEAILLCKHLLGLKGLLSPNEQNECRTLYKKYISDVHPLIQSEKYLVNPFTDQGRKQLSMEVSNYYKTLLRPKRCDRSQRTDQDNVYMNYYKFGTR